MRELPSSSTYVPEGSEPALSLGVSYDEGGEGLGDPSQVAQVSENRGSALVFRRLPGTTGRMARCVLLCSMPRHVSL